MMCNSLGMLFISSLIIFPSNDFLFWEKLYGSPEPPPSPIMKYKYPSLGPKSIWPPCWAIKGSPIVNILLTSVDSALVWKIKNNLVQCIELNSLWKLFFYMCRDVYRGCLRCSTVSRIFCNNCLILTWLSTIIIS